MGKAREFTKKVVIAEDDLVTRRIIADIVHAQGLTPVETSDGRVALQILGDNPDSALLITDMIMPGLDGRELVESVRKNAALSSLPIIIVSGVVRLGQIVDLLERGASRFMPKPIDRTEMAAYIEQLTRTGSSPQSLGAND